MAWSTNIDLSAPLNPNYGAPGQSLQRANRPQSLPVTAAGSITTPITTPNTPRTSVLWGTGLTISFSGPTTPVEVGRTFVWNVLIVNQGPKPAKLAIIPLPQIQRPSNQSQQFGKRHAPQMSSSSSTNHTEKRHTNGGSSFDVAPAICDENIVYALQHQNSQANSTDLLSLTPELRIGPLGAGNCYEAEIRLLALKEGPLRVEAVRVVDLIKENEEGAAAAGVIVDIRDLPDIVALKAGAQEAQDGDTDIIIDSRATRST
jgi:TRAPP trafficking subunit Trs65